MFNPHLPAPHPYQSTSAAPDPAATDGKTESKQPANRPVETSGSSASQGVRKRFPSTMESQIRADLGQVPSSQHVNPRDADNNAFDVAAIDWWNSNDRPTNNPRTTVPPNRTTFPGKNGVWPCERRAAAIQGSTIDFRNADDIEAVCIRLLQTSGSASNYKVVASIEAFLALAIFGSLMLGTGSVLQKTIETGAVAFGAMAVPPHVGISRQYAAVYNDCQKYLEGRFGSEFVDQIKKMKFDEEGLKAVIDLLVSKDPQIETLKLEEQLNKLENLGTIGKWVHLLKKLFYPEVKINLEKSPES